MKRTHQLTVSETNSNKKALRELKPLPRTTLFCKVKLVHRLITKTVGTTVPKYLANNKKISTTSHITHKLRKIPGFGSTHNRISHFSSEDITPKIVLWKFINNFWSNPADRKTDTDKLTNQEKPIPSLAEVKLISTNTYTWPAAGTQWLTIHWMSSQQTTATTNYNNTVA